MPSSRHTAFVTAAVIGGVLLRIAFALGYWVDKPLTHDEQEYLHLAGNLAAGKGFQYDQRAADAEHTVMQFGRAPLYPAFLAAVRVLGGEADVLRNVRLVQSLVGGVCILFVAAIAGRAAGPLAARTAAVLGAVYPPLVWTPAFVLSETVYSAVALGSVWVLGAVIERGAGRSSDARTGWIVGGLAGACVLLRPAHLFFLMVFAAWCTARRRFVLLAAVALASAVIVLPWTVRNYLTYGRLVLVASEGGITFWTGNHPYSPGEGDMAANPAIKLDNRRFRSEHPGLTEEALEPLYYREALEHIAARPGWWLGLLVRKAFYTVVPLGPSYTLHSLPHRVATLISWGLILPAGVIGYLQIRRRGAWPHGLVILAVSAVLAGIVFLPQERFRIPVLDPTMIVGAAGWWALRREPLAVRGA